MRLNLAILLDDLAVIEPHVACDPDWRDRRLRYAAPLPLTGHAGDLTEAVAYVSSADALQRVAGCLPAGLSVVSAGRPPAALLKRTDIQCVWTERSDVTPEELLGLLSAAFARYGDWQIALESALMDEHPLERIAWVSLPIVSRPLWMLDTSYRTVFCLVDGEGFTPPPTYVARMERERMNNSDLNLFAQGLDWSVFDPREPTLLGPYPGHYDYRSLVRGLYVRDRPMASLLVAETDEALTARDKALVSMVASYLERALDMSDLASPQASSSTHETLRELLSGRMVAPAEIEMITASLGWGSRDLLYCCTVVPRHHLYPLPALADAARAANAMFSQGVVHVVHDQQIVFVINERLARKGPHEVAVGIAHVLGDAHLSCDIGVSVAFCSLARLATYRLQACKLIERPGEAAPLVYDADAFLLDASLRKLLINADVEAFVPSGVRRLFEHDRAQGTELVRTLATFLRCDRSYSKTARALAIHRNTLSFRMEKIAGIVGYDLDDPNDRLMMLLAFALLDHEGVSY